MLCTSTGEGAHEHVLHDRHVAEHAGGLEGAAQPGAGDLRGPVRGHVTAAQSDRSRVGPQKAVDNIEQGSLASAVGADHAQDLATLHHEANAQKHAGAAEALADIGDGEDRTRIERRTDHNRRLDWRHRCGGFNIRAGRPARSLPQCLEQPTRDRHDAIGKQGDHQQQRAAIHQAAQARQRGAEAGCQPFRQGYQDRRADHGAEKRADTAEDAEQHRLDRHLHAERVPWCHDQRRAGIKRTGDGTETRAERQRIQLHPRRRHASGLGGVLVRPQRAEEEAKARAHQQNRDDADPKRRHQPRRR